MELIHINYFLTNILRRRLPLTFSCLKPSLEKKLFDKYNKFG